MTVQRQFGRSGQPRNSISTAGAPRVSRDAIAPPLSRSLRMSRQEQITGRDTGTAAFSGRHDARMGAAASTGRHQVNASVGSNRTSVMEPLSATAAHRGDRGFVSGSRSVNRSTGTSGAFKQ
jgi:hypothetical protein